MLDKQEQSTNQPEQVIQPAEGGHYQSGMNGDSTAHPAPNTNESPVSAPSVDNIELNQPMPATPEEGILSASVEFCTCYSEYAQKPEKKLESKSVKKSDDASERQTAVQKNTVKPDVPAIDTLPTQGFAIEQVDPSVIKKANQVDKWANMIDAMALNGRLRILAQQSVIGQATTDEHLILELNQSAKHLITDSALTQLRSFVSDHFNQPMQVDLVVVDETIDDPLQIQSQINDKRYDYAKQVLASDPIVNYLQTNFQAVLDESSIIAR